jgi:hypothetical protein
MQHVIVAMLAERRWDIIVATAERAGDALALLPMSWAREYLTAQSFKQVIELVTTVPSSTGWFERWRTLFTQTSGVPSENELDLICDLDGILGWTAANVLKRLPLTPEQQATLRRFADDQSIAVRWRIAHIFGAFPDFSNFELLRKLFLRDEEDDWVRYGATRSLVEMAARGSAELRHKIFAFLAENVTILSKHSRILDEFARSVVIRADQMPTDWAVAVRRVIYKLIDRSSEVTELERWSRLSSILTEKATAA